MQSADSDHDNMHHDSIELSIGLLEPGSEFSLSDFFKSALCPATPSLTGPWDDSLCDHPPLLELTTSTDDDIIALPGQHSASDLDTSLVISAADTEMDPPPPSLQ